MTRKRVYLSGPITGTEDYMERFAKAEKQLTEEGFSVVNPAKVCAQLPEDTTYEEYMDVAFALLEECDAIYMLDGWEKSCGANREYGYAMAWDMTIMLNGQKNKWGREVLRKERRKDGIYGDWI